MKKITIVILCLALISLACVQTSGPYWTPGPETATATATATQYLRIGQTLTKTPTATPAPQICAVVVAIEALHVRIEPDENAGNLTWLKNGDVVNVLDQADADWWFIERDGLSGYARSIYLKESECD
jgi:hypothetical protein